MSRAEKPSDKKKIKPELVRYDFDHPIRLVAMRTGGLDTIIYAFLLSTCVTIIILLLSLRNGKLHMEFTFWRTLLCVPFSVIAVILFQLLRELRVYPLKLIKQNVWTIDELMELTGKDRQETERIITRVLEACFTVDSRNIIGYSGDPSGPLEEGEEQPVPDAENEAPAVFSKYDS